MDSPNIIFIVVDTLRKDYAKPLEDELRKLEFISYEKGIAPASWTTPSHASIFTGLYPAFHGAHETKNKKGIQVKLNMPNLLSSCLRNLEFNTYLLSANPYICPEFGFKGFDYFYSVEYIPSISLLSPHEKGTIEKISRVYESKLPILASLVSSREFKLLFKGGMNYLLNRLYNVYVSLNGWPKDKGGGEIIKTMKKEVITRLKKTPKFVFINMMEVHEPYFVGDSLGGKGFRENLKTNRLDLNLVHKWKQKYPEEVRYITKKILELMRLLKEKNAFDRSLIIITSDHGQLLGEHGRISHGTFLYDELLKVPLLIKYPKGYEVEHIQNKTEYISLVKIKPLILNLVDNKLIDDSILYSDTVFAESYGIHQNVGEPSNEEEKKNIEELEKYRIAIYYKNFKGIFNVTDWRFEKIISYDPNLEVTDDIIKRMRKEVVKFLKTATIAKVPKIKI